MSGFGGGGFGSPPDQHPPPSFGSAPQQQQQQQHYQSFSGGGGFGSSGGGFSSGPSLAGGFGSTGENHAGSTFGSVSSTAASPFSAGTAAAGMVATDLATTFGAPTPSTFGQEHHQQPSSNQGFSGSGPSSGFGTSSSSGFGAAPTDNITAGGFGSTTNHMSRFGAAAPTNTTAMNGFESAPTQTARTAFGSSNITTSFGAAPATPVSHTAVHPFGAGESTATALQSSNFGQQQQNVPTSFAQSTSAPNPFGNASSSSSSSAPITFGSSAPSSGTFGNVNSNGPFGSSSNSVPHTTFGPSSSNSGNATFGSASTSGQHTTFGSASTASNTPFGGGGGGMSDSEEMGDGGFNSGGNSSMASAPFGAEQSLSSSSTTWTRTGLNSVPERGRESSPVPNRNAWSPTPPENAAGSRLVDKSAEDEKLTRLKAKIQAKKKKLEDQKKRKEEAATKTASKPIPKTQIASYSLNAKAPAFTPKETESLAERNARRFASDKTLATKAQLPTDLQEGAHNTTEDTTSVLHIPRVTAELEGAVSLVGVCPHMCPEDELLRREREGDIQALEVPQPGTIHPETWTLRHTVVKRFRRSAADYKLNVPEWVRPPDVLERVCGYLEEWVMERDRQGHDPRFTRADTPPPLDVYQFVWDRTRMIRKDFILQNYVGTGGNCDARAVRCHERIARWHAMCEHQLSHISDFVTMQSQQNIQELGQTMKTLNQYYDDALGRSTIEVADDVGREVQSKASKGDHGCHSDIVIGKPPVDFNGTLLKNDLDASASTRLLGSHASSSPARGTAEPEMRGLYILLTMNNDGGMEVLKYAAHLFRFRPDVYDSAPVQLAMHIYKAKKDFNYARYFSILRSPSTPYLFSCIMFKYVEQMRKVAFRIMSKTYGAKRKDTGESLYDVYPINHLVRLLCFEDPEEARQACKHYNITTQNAKTSSGKSVEVILWRASNFCEAKDLEKGFVLPLKPWKMIRTIEKKLNGATRLAVCRGQVSGEGAILTRISSQPRTISLPVQLSQEELEKLKREEAQARKRQNERDARLRLKAKAKAEAEARISEEAKLKTRLRAEAKSRSDAKARVVEEARKKAESKVKAAAKARAAEEDRRQAGIKLQARAQAKAEEEARQMKVAKAKAIEDAREAEEIRLKAEAKGRAELEARAAEEARLKAEAKAIAEVERRRREEEAVKLRILQLQRHNEAEERRRKEEEERRIAMEWEQKVNSARKQLVWRRWMYKLGRQRYKSESLKSLQRIDPTFEGDSSMMMNFREQNVVDKMCDTSTASHTSVGVGYYLNRLILRETEPFNLSKVLRREIGESAFRQGKRNEGHEVLLCKLAVILPSHSCYEAQSMYELIHKWIDSRLRYGLVDRDYCPDRLELRTVTVRGQHSEACQACDVALFVIPPSGETAVTDFEFVTIDDSIPRVVLNLEDSADLAYSPRIQATLSEVLGDEIDGKGVISPSYDENFEANLDVALGSACEVLVKSFANGYTPRAQKIELFSVSHVGVLCISDAIWRSGFGLATKGDDILNIARAALTSLVIDIDEFANDLQRSYLSVWPAKEFLDETGLAVNNYFRPGQHLPQSWIQALRRNLVEPAIMELDASLNGSLQYVIDNLLIRAPINVRHDVDVMFEKKQFRRCLESALAWREANEETYSRSNDHYIYLPKGKLQVIIKSAVERLSLENDPSEEQDEDSSHQLSLRDWNRRQNELDNDLTLLSTVPSAHLNRVEYVAVVEQSDNEAYGGEEYEDGAEPIPIETPLRSAQETLPAKETRLELQKDEEDTEPIPVDTPLRWQGSFKAKTTTVEIQEEESFLSTNKRALDSVDAFHSTISPMNISKRRRENSALLSKNQKKSQDFTKQLETYLNGEATVDVEIGNVKLSDLLRRDVPNIDYP